jgi:hypothetical protein
MKRLFAIGAIVLCGLIAGTSSAQAGESVDQALVTRNLSSMPFAFTKNMGQWPDSVLFRADAGGANMWITTEVVYYRFTRHIPSDSEVMTGSMEEGGLGSVKITLDW